MLAQKQLMIVAVMDVLTMLLGIAKDSPLQRHLNLTRRP
jgi:hypothetical protein